MEFVLTAYSQSASKRKNQSETDFLSPLLKILEEPDSDFQPDREELASR
jgi:hypothetical protein